MEKRIINAFLGRDDITRIFTLRPHLTKFQRVLGPMGEVAGKLVRLDLPCIDAECLVPESRDAILSREAEDALWQEFFTAVPARRREFEPSSKRRKRRPVSLPDDMG